MKIADVLITAIGGTLSVGVMLYGIFLFGLSETWPELVLNAFYIACLVMIWMFFYDIRITARQFNYWCSISIGMTVLLRDILCPPPLASFPMRSACFILAVILLCMLTYYFARREWKTYTKGNLWLIFGVDALIAILYNIDLVLFEPVDEYTSYLLTEIWIRPTITYGLVACFIKEKDIKVTNNTTEETMKQTLILGNIITMDEKKPFAKAAIVKDGVFAYIGSAEEARKLVDKDTPVMDYGDNFIYPGFLESHCHGHLAGYRAIGQADLTKAGFSNYPKYREVIKEFIAKNPQRDFYLAAGWVENDEYVSKTYLDEICSDKPLIMQTGGGHSMLLNTKAMEWAGIDAEYARKWGYDLVHVDKDGNPDGYICEGPVFEIVPKLPTSVEDIKEYLLAWQDIAFKSGFTAVGDAGVEVVHRDAPQAYYELEQEGKLKLRTYAWIYVTDNIADPKAEIARIAAQRAQMSGEYFNIIGAKAFLDGVTEAHTGWQNQDYLDTPGYHGAERFNDHDKMVQLIVEADKEGMSVHVHSEGGGATHYMLGCIEDAEKITGNLDQRNVLAHLHFVTDEDVRRMAATGSVPAVPPLWTPKAPGMYEQEVGYVGQELTDQAYPIKSFFDAGATTVFHSDYPVSPMMDIKLSVYTAEKRDYPKFVLGGVTSPRNLKEAITREQSLRAMTINVARLFHQEHRLGSIEFGKIANMTVYDCDFLHDDIEKVAQANIIATIVDGEEVYKA